MSTRSVRLDDDAERALADLRRHSKATISDTIKLSLLSFRNATLADQRKRPSDFFAAYRLGEGGYSIGPAREAKRLLKDKLTQRRARR